MTEQAEVPADWSRMRKLLYEASNSQAFDICITSVILLNVVTVILETDAMAKDEVDNSHWTYRVNYALLALYTLELLLKLYVYRMKFFDMRWNIIDMFVVGADVFFFLLTLITSSQVRVSILRVFRLIRLIRAFKAASFFKELDQLLRGFVGALKAIFWGTTMIILILAVASILAVQLIHPINQEVLLERPEVYDGCIRCPVAFSTVWNSLLTFFQQLVAGDSWGLVSVPIMEQRPWTFFFFLAVLVLTCLVMLNLILAVIVEAAAHVQEEDMHSAAVEAEKRLAKAKLRLIELCSKLDKDGNATLNKEEFLNGYYTNQEFADCLKIMEVEPQDMECVFHVLDVDGSGDVNSSEFVDQLQRVKTQPTQLVLFNVSDIRRQVMDLTIMVKTLTEEPHAETSKALPWAARTGPYGSDATSTGTQKAPSRSPSEPGSQEPCDGQKSTPAAVGGAVSASRGVGRADIGMLERLLRVSEELLAAHRSSIAALAAQTAKDAYATADADSSGAAAPAQGLPAANVGNVSASFGSAAQGPSHHGQSQLEEVKKDLQVSPGEMDCLKHVLQDIEVKVGTVVSSAQSLATLIQAISLEDGATRVKEMKAGRPHDHPGGPEPLKNISAGGGLTTRGSGTGASPYVPPPTAGPSAWCCKARPEVVAIPISSARA